jgi:hypothetical protein
MAAPNIVNVVNISGSTAVQQVTTSATAIVSNTAASNTVVKVNNLVVANVNGTAAATITATVYRGSVDYRLAYLISVPAGSSLVVIDKATGIYLQEGDSLRLTASANSYLEAVCSYETLS